MSCHPAAQELTPIALIANESYAVGLAVALATLTQTSQPLPRIYVLDTGLTQLSRHRLEQVHACAPLP